MVGFFVMNIKTHKEVKRVAQKGAKRKMHEYHYIFTGWPIFPMAFEAKI